VGFYLVYAWQFNGQTQLGRSGLVGRAPLSG